MPTIFFTEGLNNDNNEGDINEHKRQPLRQQNEKVTGERKVNEGLRNMQQAIVRRGGNRQDDSNSDKEDLARM